MLARLIGQKLSENMGQPVIVENRPGASTMIGAELVAKAAPDGYTLLSTAAPTFAVNPSLYKKMPYDPVNDFAPVTMTARFTLLLVVGADFPAATVKDFIAVAKSKPRELNFASPGQASTHQLAMELFMQRAGIEMVHIPYKGAGPAVQDLLAGRVPTMFLDLATGNEHIKAGKIRALGIATPTRFPEMPQLPTISEAGADLGLRGFEASAWQGVVAPARTPPAIINKLNAEIARALADPGVKQKLYAAGVEPLKSTPEEFAAYIKSETTKWAEVISRANITVN
jgi:tripartite-type tricarboxylate transporter receptor subunit TctC